MDPSHLTQKSQEALRDAQTKALRFGHQEVDGEHLLLALLDQPEGIAPRLLSQTGADPGRLRKELEAELSRRPRVTGPGVQPYLQFPWSHELGNGWGTSGMFTTFFFPSNPLNHETTEATFVIEKKISERVSLFAEYVGDFPSRGSNVELFNMGGEYLLTRTQQVDFHIAFGLNRNSPDYIVGVGYSWRLDNLFAKR